MNRRTVIAGGLALLAGQLLGFGSAHAQRRAKWAAFKKDYPTGFAMTGCMIALCEPWYEATIRREFPHLRVYVMEHQDAPKS